MWHGPLGVRAQFICISGQPARWLHCSQGSCQVEGCINEGPPPLPGQPLAPGSFLIPQVEPDPPVKTGPALMVILSCRPNRLAPLGYWLSFQALRELESRSHLPGSAPALLPALAKDRTWVKGLGAGGAAGRCVSALLGHQPLRAWSQDGFGLVQEISVRRKPGFLETTCGSSRNQEYSQPGQVNGRSWP